MIRLRPEQLETFRKEMRVALADRLARRGAERFPERALGHEAVELRAEALRLAVAARERGLVSEEDVTLFYDLSLELGPGFEQGPAGAWARQVLKDRTRSPHERIVALRERSLGAEPWSTSRSRSRSAATGRSGRTSGKGPPRRLDALKGRRAALDGLALRLRASAGADPTPRDARERDLWRERVEQASARVQTEHAFRLELERLAAGVRKAVAAHRAETEPAAKQERQRDVERLAARHGAIRVSLAAHLAEDGPRKGSADAEDPCVARITTDRISERAAIRAEAERRLRVARDLCEVAGSASEGDRFVVAFELARMSGEALDRLRRGGTRVVVCRGSVADHRGDLAGARPLGWPPGSSWSDVPGYFDGTRNEVVLATRGHGPRRAGRVPRTGEGHASANLAIHLAHHGLDERCRKPSSSAAFEAARSADREALPGWCLQPGPAGLDESWAESAARFCDDPEEMETALPSLHRYWAEGPGDLTGKTRGGDVIREDQEVRPARTRHPSSIGAASLDAEGAIVLELRASDGRGILGDGRVMLAAASAQRSAVLDHVGGLLPGETKPFPPWPEGR